MGLVLFCFIVSLIFVDDNLRGHIPIAVGMLEEFIG